MIKKVKSKGRQLGVTSDLSLVTASSYTQNDIYLDGPSNVEIFKREIADTRIRVKRVIGMSRKNKISSSKIGYNSLY